MEKGFNYHYIYVIENIATGKSYVGSTCDLNQRYKAHKSMLLNNKHHNIHLQRAFNKYGKDNFQFIELPALIKAENVLKIEEFYINIYNKTFGCYNIIKEPSIGTVVLAKHNSKPLLQYDLNNNLVREWNSMREAARLLNISRTNIRTGISKGRISNGFIWKYK